MTKTETEIIKKMNFNRKILKNNNNKNAKST